MTSNVQYRSSDNWSLLKTVSFRLVELAVLCNAYHIICFAFAEYVQTEKSWWQKKSQMDGCGHRKILAFPIVRFDTLPL